MSCYFMSFSFTMADADSLDDPFTTDAPVPAPKKKKSLFAKSWSKPVSTVEQKEGIDFFSRAGEIWPGRIADEERKRQKKSEKLERKRSTVSVERKHSCTPDGKRRRLLQKDAPERLSSDASINFDDPDEASWTRRESTLSTPGSRKSGSRRKPHTSPTFLTDSYTREISPKNKEVVKREIATRRCVSLSDSDDGGGSIRKSGYTGMQPICVDNDDDDVIAIVAKTAVQIGAVLDVSDEEFPELARQARQREQQKTLERLRAVRSVENQDHNANRSNMSDYEVDDIFLERPSASEDPRVEIFISSVMMGTKELIVRRKLSQKVKEARLVWCDKQSISGQPFPKSVRDSIFLTWRGKRLFDVTSCQSLGLKIDGTGQLYSDGEGVIDGRIHFEAWTQELFDENQRKLVAKQAGSNSDDEPDPVKEDPVQAIRITLRAQGREDMKLKVKPSTPIVKFIHTFRSQRGRPEDRDVTLYFDGDKLDPEGNVENTEIEDLDVVEVHIQ